MSTKPSKLIALRIPLDLYEMIFQKAKEEDRSISNYIKKTLRQNLDTTDYLLSTEANKAKMYKMLETDKKEDSLTFNNVEEIKEYVQNLAD